jgi:hypothetical protein
MPALLAASGFGADVPPVPRGLLAPEGGQLPFSLEAEVEPDIRLVWFDPVNCLPAGFLVVAEEVRAIFRNLGTTIAWRVGGNYGEGPIPEIPIILLAEEPGLKGRSGPVMGLVRLTADPVRAVWVFLNPIRAGLGEEPSFSGPSLARAVARIVAHEVVHAVVPDEPHASKGLMRHALGRKFLLGSHAAIDGRCAAAFRARLAERGRLQPAG